MYMNLSNQSNDCCSGQDTGPQYFRRALWLSPFLALIIACQPGHKDSVIPDKVSGGGKSGHSNIKEVQANSASSPDSSGSGGTQPGGTATTYRLSGVGDPGVLATSAPTAEELAAEDKAKAEAKGQNDKTKASGSSQAGSANKNKKGKGSSGKAKTTAAKGKQTEKRRAKAGRKAKDGGPLVSRTFARLNCTGTEVSYDNVRWVPTVERCNEPPQPDYGPNVKPLFIGLSSAESRNAKAVVLRNMTGSPQLGIDNSLLAIYDVKYGTLVYKHAPRGFRLRTSQLFALLNDQASRNCLLPIDGGEPCLLFAGNKRYAIAIEEVAMDGQMKALIYYSPIISTQDLSSYQAFVSDQDSQGGRKDGQYLFSGLMSFAGGKGLTNPDYPVVFY